MFLIFIFLILVYFNVEIVSRDIEVMNSGLMKIRANDIIVVFFVTIQHHGDKPLNVMAKMVECCEKVTDDDVDCEVIQIHGENIGVFLPGSTRNITFLYPNYYGYNRRGSCTISIWNRKVNGAEDSDEIRYKIEFDTTIRFGGEEIPVFLRGLYKPEKATKCETTDLDLFDECNPVDCRLKYAGLRNFFNHKRKRCQRVPVCIGNPSKELPDVAYVAVSNTCRNLEKAVTEEDISDLLTHKYEKSEKADLESKMVNIQCHHGEIDVRSGLCVCDRGWTSEIFDPDSYAQGSSVYHMCDKRCHPDTVRKNNFIPSFIGMVLAFWVLILVILCENCDYFTVFYKREGLEGDEICYYRVGSHES